MKALFLRTALTTLALMAGGAHAACTLTLSPATLSFGSRPVAALPASEVPGYRLLGQQMSTLTGVCDSPLAHVRLRFSNVQAAPVAGLLQLPARPAQAAGALRLRAQNARAGASTVLLSVENRAGQPAASQDIADAAAVLVLQLPQPLAANTAFTVQLHMLGLLPQQFTPSQLTSFSLSPSVELLP